LCELPDGGYLERMLISTDYIEIYLNDHLAGATGGVELARRIRKSNAGEREFAPSLGRLCEEIEADRTTLEGLIDGLGVSRDRLKPIGAWVGEKVARLKPNGQLRGYSPLSRVLELEGLAMGITGKKGLWEGLRDRQVEAPPGVDFEQLAIRAEEQRATVEGLHSLAAARL
jgi:hypothetical protein